MKRKQVLKETPKKAQLDAPKIITTPATARYERNIQITAETKKNKPIPLKTLDASEQEISSDNKQQFLLLEIKQLKRQNNFLKKKIKQLTIDYGPQKHKPKKTKQKQIGSTNQNLQLVPLSINIFFDEIHNLLNTIVNLFKIHFTEQQITQYDQKHREQSTITCPLKKYMLLKKYHLKKTIERIMLQKQDSKFSMFLDLFTDYYEFKESSDQKIIEIVDKMTLRAHELNDIIIKKVQEKKKSRSTFSLIKQEDEQQIFTETLKLPLPVTPKNIVSLNTKQNTYSPATNRNSAKKNQKFHLSPA